MLGMAPGRVPLPLNVADDGPIYVNAKQYHGILRRRQSRAKLEAQNKLVKARKVCVHVHWRVDLRLHCIWCHESRSWTPVNLSPVWNHLEFVLSCGRQLLQWVCITGHICMHIGFSRNNMTPLVAQNNEGRKNWKLKFKENLHMLHFLEFLLLGRYSVKMIAHDVAVTSYQPVSICNLVSFLTNWAKRVLVGHPPAPSCGLVSHIPNMKEFDYRTLEC